MPSDEGEQKRICVVCLNCGKSFEVKLSRSKKHKVKYCSKKCMDESQKKARVKCVCEECGKEFTVKPSEFKAGVGRYCSYACSGLAKTKETGEKCRAWKGGKAKGICVQCGKPFHYRKNKARDNVGKYCSNECRHKGKSLQMKGKNNPFYGKDFSGEKNPMYGKITHSQGAWFVRRDGSRIWMRSSYEVRVANILDSLDLDWQYEPKVFKLIGTGLTYRPDFLISQLTWWEVKGYLREDARFRLDKFTELYPSEKLKIIGKTEIEQMELHIQKKARFDEKQIGFKWADYKQIVKS